MVSLVAQPMMPLAILSRHQASKCVSSNCAVCLALSRSASSVGGSSSDDDNSLESFRGAVLFRTFWAPLSPDRLDFLSRV